MPSESDSDAFKTDSDFKSEGGSINNEMVRKKRRAPTNKIETIADPLENSRVYSLGDIESMISQAHIILFKDEGTETLARR